MSTLIRRINTVKLACKLDWLTPSQARAWSEIRDRLALGDVVNLHGPGGSGKTFLAWLLVKQNNSVHMLSFVPTPRVDAASAKALPIVDNFSSTRTAFRDLLKQLAYCGYSQALILTRAPIRDDCYRVQLMLTEADIEYARQQLLSIDPTLPPSRGSTLHHLINPDLPLSDEVLP